MKLCSRLLGIVSILCINGVGLAQETSLEGREQAAKFVEEGKYPQALDLLAPLVEKSPDDAYLLRLQGYSLLKTGENDKAIATLHKAVELSPRDQAAHFFLGTALAESGRAAEAAGAFLKVVEIDSQSKYAGAVKKLLPQLKNNVQAQVKRAAAKPQAVSQETRGKLEKLVAEEKFQPLLGLLAPLVEKSPDDAYLLRLQGYALLKTGEKDKAITALLKAVEASPRDQAAYFFLGTALAESGRTVDATRAFLKVVEIDPQSKYAGVVKQLLPQLKEGMAAEAAALEAAGKKKDPTPRKPQQAAPTLSQKMFAQVQRDLDEKNYPAALQKVETLLQSSPNDLQLRKLKGLVLTESGQGKEAIGYLEEVKKDFPEDAGVRLVLAQALANENQLKEGVAELNGLNDLAGSLGEEDMLAASNELLAQMEQGIEAVKKDKWTVMTTLGMEYDTNPAAIPIVGGGQSSESWKGVGTLYLGYELIDQQRSGLPFSWEVSGFGYQSLYENPEVRNLDLTIATVGTSLRHERSFLDRPLAFTANGDWGKMYFGGDDYNEAVNAGLTADWRAWDQAGISLGYQYANENYVEDTAFPGFFSLDGNIHATKVNSYGFILGGKALLTAGYSYFDADRQGIQFTSNGHLVSTGLRVYLPGGFELVGNLSYTKEDYDLYVPGGRLDNIWSWGLGAEKSLWIDGLKGVLSYSNIVADSNQQAFNYKREILGLLLRYEY
jgi:Flp pilus assembly protein TadD